MSRRTFEFRLVLQELRAAGETSRLFVLVQSAWPALTLVR